MDKSKTTEVDSKWGDPSPMHDPLILAHFTARPTDVLITTGPKAGTTWMQQILYQLKSGGEDNFRSIETVVPWLERPRKNKTWSDMLDYYESLENPRIFKTHCTYPQTPGVDVANIILTSRDPRDCCISHYHHLMNMTDQAYEEINIQRPTSFDNFFEQWMEFGAWYRNISSWWPHKNKKNVLWLRYEDVKRDFESSVYKILNHLNWQLAEDRRSKVFTHCSFAWMKKHSEKFSTFDDMQSSLFKKGTFIRRGEIGDHKNQLNKQQEKQILDRAKSELPADCLAFLNLPD